MLIAIAAAIITVIGVVFSITILALTLASQQFGPRMLRNFMRDLGNQMTLGVFVGTFVYSVVTLGFITTTPTSQFIPHLSIAVAEALLLVDLGVLIYFINHIARSIQLPEVIARIAEDLLVAIDMEFPTSIQPEVAAPDDRRSERRRAGPAPRRAGRDRARGGERVPPVRRTRPAGPHRLPARRGDPPLLPSGPLRARGAPPRHRLAERGSQGRCGWP